MAKIVVEGQKLYRSFYVKANGNWHDCDTGVYPHLTQAQIESLEKLAYGSPKFTIDDDGTISFGDN